MSIIVTPHRLSDDERDAMGAALLAVPREVDQTGIVAAAGLPAAGVAVDPERTETNFVQIHAHRHGLTARQAVERLAAVGIRSDHDADGGRHPRCHPLEVDDDGIELAAERIPPALGVA